MSTVPATFDLQGYLAAERPRVDAALDRALGRFADRIHHDLAPAVRHGVRSGGKRLRPVLCVAAYCAVRGGEAPEAAYDLATSLEFIHAYSLMHDDLPCMDDADLRRGAPTTHREHGVAATARGGLVLIPLASLVAWEASERLACTEAVRREMVRALNGAAGAAGMVGGQLLDLDGEGRALDAGALDDLHRRKTGALLTAALTLGALAGGAADDTRAALEAYGRAVGLAFQVADDILDATATAGELGKNPSDEALDKSTYVSLHGLNEARARARSLVDEALTALAGARLEAPPLEALARYVVDRRH